jgi:hypothetical protein
MASSRGELTVSETDSNFLSGISGFSVQRLHTMRSFAAELKKETRYSPVFSYAKMYAEKPS